MIDYMMDASESIKPFDGIHLLLPSPLDILPITLLVC